MGYSDPPFQSVSEALTKFKDSLMEVNEMDGKEALETIMTMMKSEFDIDNFQNLDPSRHAEIIKYLEGEIVE